MYTYTKLERGYRVERDGEHLGTVVRGVTSRTKATKGGQWTSVPWVAWLAKRPDGSSVGAGHKTREAAAVTLSRAAGRLK